MLSFYYFLVFHLNFFNTKILISSGKLKLLARLEPIFEINHVVILFLYGLFIDLSVISFKSVVYGDIVLLESEILFVDKSESDFLFLISEQQLLYF